MTPIEFASLNLWPVLLLGPLFWLGCGWVGCKFMHWWWSKHDKAGW